MLQLVHTMFTGGAQKPTKKVYATQQEEMDAELEAAMAADAAAADTDTQGSPLAAVGYGASPGGSSKGRNGPRLELPGDGGGIDFDALDLAAPQDDSAGGDPQQARHTCRDEDLVLLLFFGRDRPVVQGITRWLPA